VRRIVQARTGALSILAVSFAASAALRAGDVLAERPDLRDRLAQAAELYETRFDPTLRRSARVMDELQRQRKELEAKEAELDERAAELERVEKRMELRLGELRAARDKLSSETKRAQASAENDVAHLARTYEAMKPKVAGQIFDQMEPVFAAGFLARMSPSAAAGILGSMSPQQAYSVTVMLAGRNVHLAEGADTPLKNTK